MRPDSRSIPVLTHLLSLLLPLILLSVSGCLSMSSSTPSGPWHEAYQPITDQETEAFVQQGLARAVAEFGEPVIPVNKILLRRSLKTAEARRYRIKENFSLTQCVDPTNGLFVIYIGVDQGHPNYHALLAHECAHLVNPKITDWYMEGIATTFSEAFCENQDVEWGDWKRHFMRSRREPYALSYRMMSQLKAICPDEYSALVRFAVPNGKGPEWMHIDIDAWLDSLPENRRIEALDIIEPHIGVLQKHTTRQYTFSVPEALQ